MSAAIISRPRVVQRSGLMALLMLASSFIAGAATAQSVGEFYKGKTIRLIVGYSAGGGNDNNARVLARFIGQYIPGTPRVVVENMPGASSLRSVLYIDGGAPTDGTAFVAFSSGLVTESITKPEQFPINLNSYAWIGSLSQETRVCYVRADIGIKTWGDLLHSPQLVFGETGRGSASYIDSSILREIFGEKLKTVLGYPGGTEKKIAVERGELDGDCTSFSTVPREWVKNGVVKVVSRGTTIVLPGIPADVPYIMDLASDPKQKTLIKFLLSPGIVGRPFITSKAVPAERLAALRTAFNAAVKDPQLIAEAERLQLPIVGPMTGQEAAAYISDLYRVTPDVIAAARRITE
jgi:tripartite-type tricarboxylate transporter receptor subunit TctC